MAKTVNARLAPRTVQLCKAIAATSDAPAHKKAIAALAAVGVDLLHRVLIELGEIAPEVGAGIGTHPQADELLTELRRWWTDDSDVEGLVVELQAARNEAAMWKKMHVDSLDRIQATVRGERDE